jgi:hypothetical protein
VQRERKESSEEREMKEKERDGDWGGKKQAEAPTVGRPLWVTVPYCKVRDRELLIFREF